MLRTLLVIATLAAAPQPFEDVHRRFTVSLPEGWSFAPIAGDDGAAFRRQSAGLLAHANVRIFDVAPGESLDAVAQALAAAQAKEPALRLVAQDATTLSGLPALRRRVVYGLRNDARFVKMVEDRFALHGGKVYIVHVEALAEAFAGFETDFDGLYRTFTIPGAGDGLELLSGPAIGRWSMIADPTTTLELRADGTFSLATAAGTFSITAGELDMRPQGGGEERFRFEVSGEVLILRSPELGEAIRYRRATSKKKGKKAQP